MLPASRWARKSTPSLLPLSVTHNSGPTSFLGEGAIDKLERILQRGKSHKVLFVVDQCAYHACGAEPRVEAALVNRDVSRFTDFQLNPKIADVQRGIEQARSFHPDTVVALGGGTAIDLGKLIGALSSQSSSTPDIIEGREHIVDKGPPLVAIPTTAGTGAEATHFAVVYIDHQKFSVAHEYLLPDFSIVDPQLTCSLPAPITAATGLDALCQGIESIWAVGATDQSIAFATEAVQLAKDNLVQAVNDPNPEARSAMCRASHLAGMAINISKTTAPHALSYSLTSNDGIPHGVAVALTLGPLLIYNAGVRDEDCADNRGAANVRERIQSIVEIFGASNARDASKRFAEIVHQIGCPGSLAEVGIKSAARFDQLVSSTNVERMSNNPRRADHATLVEILAQPFVGGSNVE